MDFSLSTIMIFFAVVTALGGAYSLVCDLWLADRSRAQARLHAEFRKQQRAKVQESTLFKDFHKIAEKKEEQQETWKERTEQWIAQSGLEIQISNLASLMLGLGLALGIVVGFFRSSWLVGGIAALIGVILPILYIHRKRKVRREKILAQLTEVFETVARVLRSGQTLPQALNVVALECERPIAEDFAFCFEQQKLGLPPDVAFQDMAKRIDILELRLFTLAAQVQQKTGGNLAELVERLAEMVRERYRTQQKIKALTAESRLQANVLLGLPPVVFVIMMIIKRDYVEELFKHPMLLLITGVFQLLGVLWIRKIVRLGE